MGKAKYKYRLRFFKNEINSDSYERDCTEDQIFIFFSICTRYLLKFSGKKKFDLTIIFNDETFIVSKDLKYPLLLRLVGYKNLEKAYLDFNNGKREEQL